jgi:glucuronyl/N-acetylglucosaminyl transferase EXT2
MKMIRRANHSSSADPVLPLHTTTRAPKRSPSHRRKEQQRAASSSSKQSSFSPFLQKKGSVSLHPGIVVAFGIFAITALFAVHLYLFSTVSGTISPVQPHSIDSTVHTEARALPEPTAARVLPEPTAARGLPEPKITPLRPQDREQYTIRINTWKRPDQLRISLDHHLSCDAVQQIQVVWCTAQGPPPDWLLNFDPKVVVEYHDENSLSERFRILLEPPTAGILSIDDDVLRPCVAMDAGFVKWVENPDRMVGFDARGHNVVNATATNKLWAYSYQSTTRNTNKYSLVLTRYAFVHRDYLDSYFTSMPAVIRETVARDMNCEDIAMSFWVSSQTGGRTPLLADLWSHSTQLALYSAKGISSTKNHKALRDACVESFANMLQLKSRLSLTRFVHNDEYGGAFECGASAHKLAMETVPSKKQVELHAKTRKWKDQEKHDRFSDLGPSIVSLRTEPFEQGYLEGSQPWKDRFRSAPS